MPTGPFLQLCLLGGMRVFLDGRLVLDPHLPRLKAKALLAYLYLERGRYVPKDELMEALWPEAEHPGLSRLKQTVLTLRRLIEPPRPAGTTWHYVVQRGGFYAFNTLADYASDLEWFEQELHLARTVQGQDAGRAALEHYSCAEQLWTGELLPEFRYESWVIAAAERVRGEHMEALDATARLLAARGSVREGIALLARSVEEDPLRETSHLELLRLLLREGRYTEALQRYRHLEESLARQLHVQPSTALRAMYETIQRERASHATER
jgi:LuxR family transcriptional regulator, maltose regulon positive regulatory protein